MSDKTRGQQIVEEWLDGDRSYEDFASRIDTELAKTVSPSELRAKIKAAVPRLADHEVEALVRKLVTE